MSDCVFGLIEERPGVVAVAVAENHDGPFREAEEGEPVIPVIFTDAWCVEHGDSTVGCWSYTSSWRRLPPPLLLPSRDRRG